MSKISMSSLNFILSTNLMPFLALGILLFFINFNSVFSKSQTRLLNVAVIVNLCMIFVMSADFYLTRIPQAWAANIRRLTTFLNFATSSVVPLILIRLLEGKELKVWLLIPPLLNVVFCFVSLFSHLSSNSVLQFFSVFKIGHLNGYDRGGFFFFPFLTTVFCLFYLLFLRKNINILRQRIERFYLFGVITILALAMTLEIAFKFYFLVWNISAVCFIMYYILLTIYYLLMDPLTGILNRRVFMNDQKKIEKKMFATLCILDLNDFKKVNDTLGHDVGDTYLQMASQVLYSRLRGEANIYRYGGDEFIVMSFKNNRENIERILSACNEELHHNDISFSFGVCEKKEFPDEIMAEEMLKLADERMYKQKEGYRKLNLGNTK